MFNKFFTSVGPDLAKQINPPVGASVFDYLKIELITVCSCHQLMKMKVIGVVESCKKQKLN